LKQLGVNALWLQPIHPRGIDGRQIDPATNRRFELGSPYAAKNYFAVMPLMASGFKRPMTRNSPRRANIIGETPAPPTPARSGRSKHASSRGPMNMTSARAAPVTLPLRRTGTISAKPQPGWKTHHLHGTPV
jgi:hypothetical protein